MIGTPRILAVSATAVMLVGSNQALSQSEQNLESDYKAAREAMLADLDDPEKAFAFAEAAAAAGDVRGAIDALERILTLNPDLTNIRLELGLLYLRVGSPELAEAYLLEVLEAPDTPPEARERAEELLSEGRDQLARNLFTGALSFSLRYESNANAVPDALLVNGIPFEPVEDAQADIAAVGSAFLRHSYDLGGQYGPLLETNLTLFGAAYSEVTTSDIRFGRLGFGPRFRFGAEGEQSVRPFLAVSTLWIGGEHYRDAAIVGVEYEAFLNDRTSLEANLEARTQELYESDVNPTAQQFEGEQYSGSVGLERELSAALSVDAETYFTVSDFSEEYESNTAVGIGLGLNWNVGNPFSSELDESLIRLAAQYTRVEYDSVNPIVGDDIIQRDDLWRVGASALVPVSERFALDLGVDYAMNESTLPNDTYENLQIGVGLRYIFRANR